MITHNANTTSTLTSTACPASSGEDCDPALGEVERAAMVAELWLMKAIRSEWVAAAFTAVRRENFTDGLSVGEVYGSPRLAVVTKRDEAGQAISSISAPQIQAFMLEMADVRPGMRVLEIGSGGTNAALLAELAGPTGSVTTIDIDPDVVARTRRYLQAEGYDAVNVVLGDADGGVAEHAPFDLIMVTVEATDIPPAWWQQLTPTGRVVVPLRMFGESRAVAFDLVEGRLVSREVETCGFVPMRGAGENRERVVALSGAQASLRFDRAAPDSLLPVLDGVLTHAAVQRWSGVRFGGMEPCDALDLWMRASTGSCGTLLFDDTAVTEGKLSPSVKRWALTLVDGASVAYRIVRPVDDDVYELGAAGHGPDGAAVADRHVELLGAWDRGYRGGPDPQIEVYPINSTPQLPPAGVVLARRHTRVLIRWPNAHAPAADSVEVSGVDQ